MRTSLCKSIPIPKTVKVVQKGANTFKLNLLGIVRNIVFPHARLGVNPSAGQVHHVTPKKSPRATLH